MDMMKTWVLLRGHNYKDMMKTWGVGSSLSSEHAVSLAILCHRYEPSELLQIHLSCAQVWIEPVVILQLLLLLD